jgi:nucleoside-diphosphate-sugar epimerase
MRALVTGGAGFIGSHLAERLVRDGHEVRVLDNLATGRRQNILPLADELELVEGDIQSYERVHNAVNGTEIVFHQAALPSVPRSVQDPLTSNATNVIGTLNILLAARDAGVQRVVFASSSSVYGQNPVLPKSEDLAPLPISPYAVAKLAGEGYCRSFWRVYGLETVCLRYFNIFGPRQDPLSQYSAVIPSFISALLERRAPTIYGDGEQSRDFTYVDNVVEANLLAASSADGIGEVFNIACGEQVSLNQLMVELRRQLDTPIEAEHAPERLGDVRHSHADVSRAEAIFGYRPRVAFADGIARTLESWPA